MTHRFTKGVADRACGALVLVRSRLAEYQTKHGQLPRLMVLHERTLFLMAEELSRELGLPAPMMPKGAIPAAGYFDGVPFEVCSCNKPLQPDLLFNRQGIAEEI